MSQFLQSSQTRATAVNPAQLDDLFFGPCGCLDCLCVRAQDYFVSQKPTQLFAFQTPDLSSSAANVTSQRAIRINTDQILRSTISPNAIYCPQNNASQLINSYLVKSCVDWDDDLPSLAAGLNLNRSLLNSPLSQQQKLAADYYHYRSRYRTLAGNIKSYNTAR